MPISNTQYKINVQQVDNRKKSIYIMTIEPIYWHPFAEDNYYNIILTFSLQRVLILF